MTITDPVEVTPPRRRRGINPVLARELQSRMRSWRAPAILTVWLLIAVGIAWLVKTGSDAAVSDPFGNPLANAALGRAMFDWVLFVMMAVLFFLIPGQAAVAFAGERERQTLIPLQVTLLSTRELLTGKILAASAFLVLLMVAVMPVLAVAYLIGGVRVSEIAMGMLAVIATGVLLATMATAISALTKRVQGAVVLSYLLSLALVLGPFLGFGIVGIIDAARGDDTVDPPTEILLIDPFVAVGDIAGDRFSGPVPSPWDGIYRVIHADEELRFDEIAIEDGNQIPDPADVNAAFARLDQDGPRVPYWVQSLLLQAALASALVLVAARRLRTPALVER